MVEVLFNIKVIGIVFDNEIKIVCEYCVGIIWVFNNNTIRVKKLFLLLI